MNFQMEYYVLLSAKGFIYVMGYVEWEIMHTSYYINITV